VIDWTDDRRKPNYTFACQECGATVSKYVRPSHKRPRFCAKSCSTKFSMRSQSRRDANSLTGARHHRWTGDAVSEKGGRKRALKLYRPMPCQACGAERSERHHIDGNTANNEHGNVAMLCRRCHMRSDGRLELVREQMRAIQPLGAKARWQK
jgi:hypothetical protein